MRVRGPYHKTNPVTGAMELVNPTAFDFVFAAIRTAVEARDGRLPEKIQLRPSEVRRIAKAMQERSGIGVRIEVPPRMILGVPVELTTDYDPEPFRVQYDGGMVVAADVAPNCLPPFGYGDTED